MTNPHAGDMLGYEQTLSELQALLGREVCVGVDDRSGVLMTVMGGILTRGKESPQVLDDEQVLTDVAVVFYVGEPTETGAFLVARENHRGACWSEAHGLWTLSICTRGAVLTVGEMPADTHPLVQRLKQIALEIDYSPAHCVLRLVRRRIEQRGRVQSSGEVVGCPMREPVLRRVA